MGSDAQAGGSPEKKPAGVLTAEWIEYEIHVPGRPALKIRRDVFDLIGPAQRAGDMKTALSSRMMRGFGAGGSASGGP